MAAVYLPRSLVALFPGAPASLTLEAATVQDVMDGLGARWPGMRHHLCDAGPSIRQHINVFVDGERSVLSTPLLPDSEVRILTAVSGG